MFVDQTVRFHDDDQELGHLNSVDSPLLSSSLSSSPPSPSHWSTADHHSSDDLFVMTMKESEQAQEGEEGRRQRLTVQRSLLSEFEQTTEDEQSNYSGSQEISRNNGRDCSGNSESIDGYASSSSPSSALKGEVKVDVEDEASLSPPILSPPLSLVTRSAPSSLPATPSLTPLSSRTPLPSSVPSTPSSLPSTPSSRPPSSLPRAHSTPTPTTTSTSTSPSSPRHIIVRSCYLLTQIDAAPLPLGRCFLSVDLTTTSRALQVVEDERVVQNILLSTIKACRGVGGKVEVEWGGRKTVRFHLASSWDAQHVVELLNRLLSSSSPSSSSLLKAAECLQKGWVEQKVGERWDRRFARLFSHHLLFYRTATSPLPLHVFPLCLPSSSSSSPSHSVFISLSAPLQLIIEFPFDRSGVSKVTWRCSDTTSFHEWSAALHLDKTEEALLSSPPASIALTPTISSQKQFMSYMFELFTIQPLFPSALPSPSTFLQSTPTSFLRRRQPALQAVDASLASYHFLLSSLSSLWSEARLVMIDEFEQSGSGQIGFSFPGFEPQVFDVGRLSVIACAQLLNDEAHPLRFGTTDYELAIESSSPAKEMMQSSPDFSSLYHEGQKDRIKALAAHSQRLLLHHCTLASHCKAHQQHWQDGHRIQWKDVLTNVADKNTELQQMYLPISYIYNPQSSDLHELIVQLKAKEAKGEPSALLSSFPKTLSPSLNSSVSASPSSTDESPVSTPRRRFFGGKSAPASPTVVKPPSPTSPLSPLSSPASAQSELRCLCDPVHCLQLLRTLLNYRRHALSTLLSTLQSALHSFPLSSPHHTPLTVLITSCSAEHSRLVFLLSLLPKAGDLLGEVRKQRREKREKMEAQEVRRKQMKEREREVSLKECIMEAKEAIEAYEEGEEEGEEEGQEEGQEEEEESQFSTEWEGKVGEVVEQAIEGSVEDLMRETEEEQDNDDPTSTVFYH